MTRQTFQTVDQLRVDVEADPLPGQLVNLIPNPDGALGAWGWITPAPGTVRAIYNFAAGGLAFEYRTTVSGVPQMLWTEPAPVKAGQWLAAQWRTPDSSDAGAGDYRARIEYEDAAGAVVAQGAQTALLGASSATMRKLAAVQVPAGAVRARLRFDLYDWHDGVSGPLGTTARSWMIAFDRLALVTAGTAAELAAIPNIVPPARFQAIVGSLTQLTIDRPELDTGDLAATLRSPELEPAVSTLIRPGRRVRVCVLNPNPAPGFDAWEPIYTGKLTTGTRVEYDLRNPDPARRSLIKLAAADPAAQLANTKRAAGVATISQLPAVLEGAGVPWDINGSQAQALDAPTISTNENASALDQVVITRDSNLGYAFVSRRGVLRAYDADKLGLGDLAATQATLTEADYTDLVIDYDTDRIINSVGIKYLRLNADGTTEEVTYGPYVDEASADEWGTHHKDFTIALPAESDAAIAAFAQRVLDANAEPALRAQSLTFTVADAADFTTTGGSRRALLDLIDPVRVVNANAAYDELLRVYGITHTITGKRWTVELTFAGDGQVATPTQTPSPDKPSGQTLAQQLRPLGEVTMFYGTKAQAQATGDWLVLDGSNFDGAEYPELAAFLGGTLLPDLQDRVPMGASAAHPMGTAGGANQRVIAAANLPPHAHTIAHTHDITRSSVEGVTATTVKRAGASDVASPPTSGPSTPNSGNGPGTSTPLDTTPAYRALHFIMRARG